MRKQKPPIPTSDERPADPPRESPLSLNRLREAFAAMLGNQSTSDEEQAAQPDSPDELAPLNSQPVAPCEINPRSVAEAMLFVGRPDSGPMSARELAAAMRGVSPTEIEDTVNELNAQYDTDQAPYYIEQSGGGYRLILRPEFERVRDKFYGRVKEARLSPAVIEVLSILAYNQPATIDQLNEFRGSPCGAALATLVRRKLVQLERPAEGGAPHYATTDRFLKLFGLESLGELPHSEELEKV